MWSEADPTGSHARAGNAHGRRARAVSMARDVDRGVYEGLLTVPPNLPTHAGPRVFPTNCGGTGVKMSNRHERSGTRGGEQEAVAAVEGGWAAVLGAKDEHPRSHLSLVKRYTLHRVCPLQ